MPPLPAALAYAGAGIPVLPLHTAASGRCSCHARRCDRAGKHPRWRPGLITAGLREASTDPALIRRWWAAWPAANVGLRTGTMVDVCDIDTAEGWHLVQRLLGPALHLFPRVRTGSGGTHLYVAATGLPSQVRLLAGVDWRGCGGYIVAPPSMHTSGTRYRWIRPLDAGLPGCPRVLLDVLAARLAPPRVDPVRPVRDPSRYAMAALDNEAMRVRTAPVGERNNTLYRAARSLGRLAAAGLLAEPDVVAVLAREGRAAGLGTAEITRTIRSGLTRPAQRHGPI
ncbi:MAG TPA: bifunctional DNA primase/polymerase [Micromonosporaceae bacterium]|nr:bifunctional DNA primase/polymerase [Micromonosporaceae bacterium]